MDVISCPNCAESLPRIAKYCPACGRPLAAGLSSAIGKQANPLHVPEAPDPGRTAIFKSHRLYPIRENEDLPTQPMHAEEDAPTEPMPGNASSQDRETQRTGNRTRDEAVIISPSQWQRLAAGNDISFSTRLLDDEDGIIHDQPEMRPFSTWNKVVRNKNRSTVLTPPQLEPLVTPDTPPPVLPTQRVRPVQQQPPPRRPQPKLFFWLSTLAIIALLLGGIFGIVNVLGRSPAAQSPSEQGAFSLQVTPSTIALGGTITLRGTRFSPHGRVGLTRDTNIPVIDTGGAHIITTNGSGNFTDTVTVDPTWLSGSHTIQAEDAATHKTASFAITVTGKSTSKPPHLEISVSALNLGSGDQATDSAMAITLNNAGGGTISWQSGTTQPWLLLSPNSGTFVTGQPMKVTIAGDRANLKQGAYQGNVIFSSNAGQLTLPVKMNVTRLEPQHEAVLQLMPGVLSFTGIDGGANPVAQIVTISNPGLQPLQWSASSSTEDGSNWLAVAPLSGMIGKGGSLAVKIGVNTSMMLPGTYSGRVTFSSTGPDPVKDSPQTIFVSLTILPQCAVQVSPGSLTFTTVSAQPSPTPKTINVGLSQGCSSPMRWNASVTTNNGGHWLSIGQSSGTTPAHPQVSVDSSGLAPATYSGALIFSTKSGNQTIPVTLIVAPSATPVLSLGPATMNFSAIYGEVNPSPQVATITNAGGGTLAWDASATTSTGAPWLSLSTTAGSLSAGQAANISVTATLLQSLSPGTYNGTITFNATDGSGNPAMGSPQSIPVIFVVQPPCTIGATPLALSFTSIAGQENPAAQVVSIAASGACAHALNWTASANTSSGGTWLSASPASGTVSLSTSSSTNIGVSLAGLSAGSYSGTVTITAVDSVSGQPTGTPQTIAITLTVQPPCMLQAPSDSGETYSTEVGLNPTTQTFSIAVSGTCSGSVTITPTVTTGDGGNWLAVTPSAAQVTSGNSATFTVTVTSASLSAGTYNGTVSLAAVDSNGMTTEGSPQQVGITTNVIAAPVLNAGPGALTFNVNTGSSDQQIAINNAGGEPLNWTAALDPNAPSFVSLSATSGTGLVGGTGTSIDVIVDASGLQGGTTYTTSATISAIDPITGNAVVGSPVTVPITINIAPPTMQLSSDSLTFTANVGVNPDTQAITITNTGGNSLTWTTDTPSQSWLAVSPTSGSDDAGQSSSLTFAVDVTGLSAGTYSATVDITPSSGNVVTVTVSLTVS
ncbi:MAG TPA: hypothetical protein VKV20_14715 [Ktedonobacteraceae bacterium]|nr:hypothetical protein [Ktedonobacteraceae bacterium]